MRALLLVVLVGCSRSQPSATVASASAAPVVADAGPPAPKRVELAETDFRGTFNGAKLVATLRAKDGIVTGSCFYEAFGADIPLRGTAKDDGTLVVSEMKGDAAVSTVTLTRAADGTLSGTWSTPQKSGPATLTPVVHAPGGTIEVATRPHVETSLAICGWNGSRYDREDWLKDVPKGPCRRASKAPVVLGLADRAFEKRLNDALFTDAKMAAPNNADGVGVDVTYTLPLSERGILSVVFTAKFSCGNVPDCSVDNWVDAHNWGASFGVTVAVDAGVIAKSPADFVDFSKVRPVVRGVLAAGFAQCVSAGPEEGWSVQGAVLGESGLSIEHDECVNHVHSDAWTLVPYAKLGPALKAGPFEAAWK